MDAPEDLRMDVLRRLAEQAMSDLEFRVVARDDLEGALRQYGYDLNERELALVLQFRSSLAEAGVDLDLTAQLGPEYLEMLNDAMAKG
ncbi:MAG: hypothetical protein ACR2OO_15075 [Thermomicrobiales bacterium]